VHRVCRFNIVWNVIIGWISISAGIAVKNIRLADKVYNFSWNLTEPQKFRRQRGTCYKMSEWHVAAAAA